VEREPASGGEGPPQEGGLDARFARLEAGVSDVKATLARFEAVLGQVSEDLSALRSDLKGVRSGLGEAKLLDFTDLRVSFHRLEDRVTRLPSTIQMIGFVLAVLAISGAVRLSGAP
jgi:hypothetical protein